MTPLQWGRMVSQCPLLVQLLYLLIVTRVGLKVCTCFGFGPKEVHFWRCSWCGDTDEAFRESYSSMTTCIYNTRDATWTVSRLDYEKLRHDPIVWNAFWFCFLRCISCWCLFAIREPDLLYYPGWTGFSLCWVTVFLSTWHSRRWRIYKLSAILCHTDLWKTSPIRRVWLEEVKHNLTGLI